MTIDAPCLVPGPVRADELLGCWAVWTDKFASAWEVVRAELARVPVAPVAALSTMQMMPGKGGKQVAVVKAQGVLLKNAFWFGTSTLQMRQDIRAAAGNPDVSGILLRIDSPGGTVAGLYELADEVKSARRKKPVWAHIEDMGASAAYWVASQADVVYAGSPTALVGSIGTIMTVYDMSALAEREGVKPFVFATGPLKGAGTPGTPVTEDQQSYFQGIINETQTHFDAAVRAGRGMTASQLAAVRSGEVFTATKALELKLIDGIKPLDKVLAELSAAT